MAQYINNVIEVMETNLPDQDPPYTQLTTDQIEAIETYKKALVAAKVPFDFVDSSYSKDNSSAYTQGTENLAPAKKVYWNFPPTEYISRIELIYNTSASTYTWQNVAKQLPSGLAMGITTTFLIRTNGAIKTNTLVFHDIYPKAANVTIGNIVIPADAIGKIVKPQNAPSGGPIGEYYLRASGTWTCEVEVTINILDSTLNRVTDKLCKMRTHLHSSLLSKTGATKTLISVHAGPMVIQDFVNRTVTVHAPSVVDN